MTRGQMQVLENQGVTFGQHVKKMVSDNFQIFEKKTGTYVSADSFRTDIPVGNYSGYVKETPVYVLN
jgi:hypothetical protein